MRSLSDALAMPSECAVCGRWPSRPVCDACRLDLAPMRPRCARCALPVQNGHTLCPSCLTGPVPALSACQARLDYSYPWVELLARFKFRQQVAWARVFAELMLEQPACADLLTQADLWVPVPLSPERLRERGYHQTWELARALRRRLPHRVTAVPDLLQRRSGLPVQHSLPRAARTHNARAALSCHPRYRSRLVQGHAVLIDDVMTTGATLEAAAQVLLEAGAQRVSACVLARTALGSHME